MAPGKDGYLPPEACGNILMYRPSFAAAVLFVVLFGITTGVHIVQGFAYKKVPNTASCIILSFHV